MTDMLLTLLSAALISKLMLQMPLAVDSALAPLARQQVHALRLVTTMLLLLGNAGVLGVVLLGTQNDQGLPHMIALSLGSGLGFWLISSLFNDLRQRIADNDIPVPFRGLPVALISAGLMAFLGFNTMIKV